MKCAFFGSCIHPLLSNSSDLNVSGCLCVYACDCADENERGRARARRSQTGLWHHSVFGICVKSCNCGLWSFLSQSICICSVVLEVFSSNPARRDCSPITSPIASIRGWGGWAVAQLHKRIAITSSLDGGSACIWIIWQSKHLLHRVIWRKYVKICFKRKLLAKNNDTSGRDRLGSLRAELVSWAVLQFWHRKLECATVLPLRFVEMTYNTDRDHWGNKWVHWQST